MGVDVDDARSLSTALLGQPRAWRAGVEVSLGPPRRRAVFAVLAMRANRVVSRDELVSAVWGESAPASARRIVYTHVSDLRKALEPQRHSWAQGEVLTTTQAGYLLRVPNGSVDALRFDAHLDQARRCRETGDRTDELAALDSALVLWQGEPFAGLPGPFADTQRIRLNEQRLMARQQRAALLLDTDRPNEPISELTGLLHEHPLREELYALLMTALARCGRRVDALQLFRQARATMMDQLGAEPSAALRVLHERILVDDPALGGVPRRQTVDVPEIDPTPELSLPPLDESQVCAPETMSLALTATVRAYVDSLGPTTRRLLQSMALLGTDCTIAELTSITGGWPADALAADVLVSSDNRLRFRHPLVRHVLYDRIPVAVRIGLHRQLAETLAHSSTPERVAAQLLAGPVPMDAWVCEWLSANLAALDPGTAVELLRHAITQDVIPAALRTTFTAALARLLLPESVLETASGNASCPRELRQGTCLAEGPAIAEAGSQASTEDIAPETQPARAPTRSVPGNRRRRPKVPRTRTFTGRPLDRCVSLSDPLVEALPASSTAANPEGRGLTWSPRGVFPLRGTSRRGFSCHDVPASLVLADPQVSFARRITDTYTPMFAYVLADSCEPHKAEGACWKARTGAYECRCWAPCARGSATPNSRWALPGNARCSRCSPPRQTRWSPGTS